jgi:hypothetical protein
MTGRRAFDISMAVGHKKREHQRDSSADSQT